MTSQTFESHVRESLDALKGASLLREPRTVSGPQGPVIVVGGRQVLSFCSNNYLGLAGDPRIANAAIGALQAQGTGAGASRHISGTSELHVHAEARLAQFVKLPAGLLFSSGYAANVGAIQALVGKGDAIFSDSLNHASLIDGARLSRAEVHVYRHRDHDHLSELLAQHREHYRAALVLTESLFSMEGDFCNLGALRRLADRYHAGLLVDEAHALGVFGPKGRGLCIAAAVVPDVLIGTLGKAFGTSGAFVGGSVETVRLVENRARSHVFSTAPLPAAAAAAAAAIELVEHADAARAQLLAHAARLREGLRDLGYRVLDGDTPIVPVHVGQPDLTMALSAALLEQGVFVHGIRPPTVPVGTSRLRLTPMATHTPEHVETCLAAFQACRRLLQ